MSTKTPKTDGGRCVHPNPVVRTHPGGKNDPTSGKSGKGK
jgi:hypothetical protein